MRADYKIEDLLWRKERKATLMDPNGRWNSDMRTRGGCTAGGGKETRLEARPREKDTVPGPAAALERRVSERTPRETKCKIRTLHQQTTNGEERIRLPGPGQKT